MSRAWQILAKEFNHVVHHFFAGSHGDSISSTEFLLQVKRTSNALKSSLGHDGFGTTLNLSNHYGLKFTDLVSQDIGLFHGVSG
jgi:hypothetical protein